MLLLARWTNGRTDLFDAKCVSCQQEEKANGSKVPKASGCDVHIGKVGVGYALHAIAAIHFSTHPTFLTIVALF